MTNALARLEYVHRELAELSTPQEAKKLMDMAAAAETYAKKAKLGEESEVYAHRIKIDAQTALGGFLAAGPKPKNGRPSKNRSGKEHFPRESISRRLSHESQKLHRAKERAPELHAKVRENKIPVARVPQILARAEMTAGEREKLDRAALVKENTRWLEGLCSELNSGVSAKKKAQEIDASVGIFKDDPQRKLTSDRLRSAGAWLVEVAKEWDKLQ